MLLLKVKQHKVDKYFVDEAAREKGVTVLRLPPYHCELNPIELIWADVKGDIAGANKNFKFNDLKNNLVPQAIAKITAERWQNCISHVIKEEKKMKTLDGILDDMTDKLINL